MRRTRWMYFRAILTGALAAPAVGCSGEARSPEETHAHATAKQEASLHETFQDPTCGFIPCPVSVAGNVLTLVGSCATFSTMFIPEGYTLDGAGHSIIAIDGPTTHFVGPIARNCGTSASYRNLRLMMLGLASVCDVGDDMLTGIVFDNASGSVVNTQLFNIRHGDGSGGCQEGVGVMVRNEGTTTETRTVDIRNSFLVGHQKAGIVATGDVVVNVTRNRIMGAGPIGNIAQAGVQLGLGATGSVVGNSISGHSYTGEGVAAGILVYGGEQYGGPLSTGVTIRDNALFNNDIGVYLAQGNADGSPPPVPTDIEVVGNLIHYDDVTNGYVYQAGISDLGTGNVIHSNVVTGAGYDPATLPEATYAVDVLAGAAANLTFLTPAHTSTVGTCSGPLIVQTQDASGNLSRSAATTFDVTATGPASVGLQFFANASCTGPAVTTLDLGNAQAQATFSFRARTPGSAVVSVGNGALSRAQTQQVLGGLAPGREAPLAGAPLEAPLR
ncbi:right-handed parallel beta-helix repeat-containing protein [Myxococcus sp. Y35]|uniref:right-handed parallel beta-helix repeat-containing protein n=1 Tax=Pseudomyxococcus flavus TaxID=3115648 RepID=UPI003CFBBA20